MMNRLKFLILVFSVSVIFSCSTDKEIDWKQYKEITDASEVSDYYLGLKLNLSGKYEKAVITKYFDGSKELTYEYELLEALDYDPLFYSVVIETNKSISEANTNFKFMKKGLITGSKWADLTTEEVKDIDLPKGCYYALRYYEGFPNGVLFMARKGKNNYYLITSGLYTEDHSLITDLVLPDIENLESFKIN